MCNRRTDYGVKNIKSDFKKKQQIKCMKNLTQFTFSDSEQNTAD